MAANQYLIPGGTYVNEDTDTREFLIPGDVVLTETSTAAVEPPAVAQPFSGGRPVFKLAPPRWG